MAFEGKKLVIEKEDLISGLTEKIRFESNKSYNVLFSYVGALAGAFMPN